jgi:aspartate aminotransferase
VPELSKRLNNFEPSKIAEIFSLASRLKEQGEDIADLSTGEPDFATNPDICAAAKTAIDQGRTKYTSIDGTTDLKRAIQKKFKVDNQLEYALNEIIVDSGAKPLLAHVFLSILDDNVEVIIPTPCWPSHPGVVRLCGANPVLVKTTADHGFKLDPGDLKRVITEDTRAILLNSPSNPTGAVYSADELHTLAEVLVEYPQIWIIADDIYEKLLYDGRKYATIAQVEPRLKNQTITVNGLSKAYAMTGWRIGYAGGPAIVMQAVREIMSQATGNACSISQAAGVVALTGNQDYLAKHVDLYQARRDRVVERINQARGLSVTPCEGAFYLYVNCSGVIGTVTSGNVEIHSSTDFVRYLLEEHKVAVVPGTAFEYDPYFRLSFATSDEQLEKACDRILLACDTLR